MLLFEFLFECDFPLDHTNISKKSIKNTSGTWKSHQLKAWTLQDFPWWGTSLIWQQFASEPHFYQQDIANCMAVNQAGNRGAGELPVEARQKTEPSPGQTSWWDPVCGLKAGREEEKQRNHAEVWGWQGNWGGSAVGMRGQPKQHLERRGTSRGKVRWTKTSEAERHVQRTEVFCLGKDWEPLK